MCDPPLLVACVTLYSLALARAQKWCMALNGSGEMRLDGEAERLSLLHHLDFALCFAKALHASPPAPLSDSIKVLAAKELELLAW